MSAPYTLEQLLASPFGDAIRVAIKGRAESRKILNKTMANARANRTRAKVDLYVMAKKRYDTSETLLKNAMAMAVASLKKIERTKAETRKLLNQQRRVQNVLARGLRPQHTEAELENALRGLNQVSAEEAAGAGAAAAGAAGENIAANIAAIEAEGNNAFANLTAPLQAPDAVASAAPAEKPKECKPGFGCKCRRGNAGCSIMGGKSRRQRRSRLRKSRRSSKKATRRLLRRR